MTERKSYNSLEVELYNLLNAESWKGKEKNKAETFKDILTEFKTNFGLELSTEFLIQLCESNGLNRSKATEKISKFVLRNELQIKQEVETVRPLRIRRATGYGEDNREVGFILSENESQKQLHFFN